MVKTLSLRKRILWLFILSTLAISLISIVLLLNDIIKKAHQDIEDQTNSLSVAMLPMLKNTLVVGDLATVEQTFRALIKDAHIRRLVLLDSKTQHPLIDIFEHKNTNLNTFGLWFQSFLDLKIPPHKHRIQVGGVDYGTILIEISTDILIYEIWHVLLYLITLGGVALTLGLMVLSAILSRGLAPLLKLAQMAERFGKGEFSQRAPKINVPEIAVTAQAFNHMADNISFLLEQIKHSEETKRQLAAIVEQSEEAMLTIDLNGYITSWNLGAEKLYGYARKEALGKNITFLLPFHHSNDLINILKYDKNKLSTRRYEMQMLDFNGRLLDIAMTATPLLNSQEEHIGEICIGRDITERKKFEQDLLQAKETAETAMRAKATFLAMMSHEIRTPMNGIIGMTRLALSTSLNDEQRDYLKCVQSSADSLLIILNDILDLSKIEMGKLTLEITPFSIQELIHDVVKLFIASANDKDIILTANISPLIPSHLLGDPVRLRQIISNLLNNAFKFTFQGKIEINVIPHKINKENLIGLQFSVSDTGIGISEDKLEMIFAPFSQADSSTTRYFGGTGLGLTISSRLIELMNGRIWVESTLGKGSTFYFTIELELLDPDSLISLQNESTISEEIDKKYQIQSMVEHNRKYRILLVEDNIFNQKVASILLEKMGYEVIVANDGFEAINCLKSNDYDMVFMDMQMPNLDGLEATRRIRASDSPVRNPHLPIIAMTANAMQEDRECCLEAGMNDYISKPINVDDLQTVLKKTLAF